MQLYELEKRLTMDVKFLAKKFGVNTDRLYINVQTSKGAYGQYSKNRWLMGEDQKKVDELALNPEFFKDPLEIIDTMIHELVHVYCEQKEIKDTSRNGYYHNQKFKQIAEQFGLLCIATDSGWNTTSKGNEENLEKINSELPYKVTSDMIRRGTSKPKRERTPREVHKYTCPTCKKTIKDKELIYIYCLKDREGFILDQEDPKLDEWIKNLKEMTRS